MQSRDGEFLVSARDAPATRRNRGPILVVLRQILPRRDDTSTTVRPLVLEVASGTGQHAVFMASMLPHVDWRPSDRDSGLPAGIAAWARDMAPPDGPANLLAPLEIDVTARQWPVSDGDAARLAAIFSANMLHIAPWTVAEGLMAGAGRLLPAAARLYLYGPFKRGGHHTSASNEAFDDSLRQRNPAWGVRDLDDIGRLAERHGLDLENIVEMPANNLSVIFAKR